MLKHLIIASVAFGVVGAASHAATLSGDFLVKAYNVTNLNSTESQATSTNILAADNGTLGGGDSVITSDQFTYSGDFDFNVGGPQTADPYSIATWLGTGTGTVTGLDNTFGDLQLSFPNISNGSATTTFFQFQSIDTFAAADFSIRHDDGVSLFDDGDFVDGSIGPNSVKTTNITGFDGGVLSLVYVATNGNPSILEVDMTPTAVPLPAGGVLLISGMAGFAALRRRKKAA